MRSINLPYKVISHYNRTQANDYLKDRNVLVVIPSILDNSPYTVYECLISNVNFIASNVGGIAELIPEYAHDNILFELNPARLSDKIKLRLDNIDCKPGLIYSQCYINGLWLDAFSFCYINHALEVDEYNFPLVSVCITHHDRSELLQQAIASLRTQSYKNIEIILVDDGSVKEESYNYLNLLNDEFEKNNWKIITGENNYLGAARNLAAKHAKGDYLLFMDDDNVAKPCEIENFIKAAINTQADILTTPSDLIFDMEFPAPFRKMTHCWLPLGDDLNIAAFNNCFGDANALIKRSVFIDMGGFTEDVGVGHEDWEFFLKAVLKGYNLMVVPEALFWYRVSPSGMLLSGNKARNEFRSYRPFINDNLKYGFAMSMLPALLQQVDELKSQLEHASNNSMLIDVNNKVDALYSQQQFGWAHDRFMVLDNKLDIIKDSICNANNHGNTLLKILRKIKNMLTN
ncbi:glycosyltransferase [Shimwellia pseudoproteus]|uniref:glycosyltransferase n=1 Tax=Shimwellia pseudoproteus TaxID=570012 RepID=UPI0018EAA1F4|nr:glycosyltransferase family 2 protein [Shimwellia pseudoproteus]MBJ3817110.1 glycosyltransferase [Shimwellia pseudoproteus]